MRINRTDQSQARYQEIGHSDRDPMRSNLLTQRTLRLGAILVVRKKPLGGSAICLQPIQRHKFKHDALAVIPTTPELSGDLVPHPFKERRLPRVGSRFCRSELARVQPVPTIAKSFQLMNDSRS